MDESYQILWEQKRNCQAIILERTFYPLFCSVLRPFNKHLSLVLSYDLGSGWWHRGQFLVNMENKAIGYRKGQTWKFKFPKLQSFWVLFAFECWNQRSGFCHVIHVIQWGGWISSRKKKKKASLLLSLQKTTKPGAWKFPPWASPGFSFSSIPSYHCDRPQSFKLSL